MLQGSEAFITSILPSLSYIDTIISRKASMATTQ